MVTDHLPAKPARPDTNRRSAPREEADYSVVTMGLHWSFKTKLMLIATIFGLLMSIHVCLQPPSASHPMTKAEAWAILHAAGYL